MTTRLRKPRRTGPYTFEDFCEIIRDDQKADLIDGVIYMASPENTDANDLIGWLFTVMRVYTRRTKQGRIFGSRVALRLAEKHGPEPDIAFVHTEHLNRVKRGHVAGAADLAVEIVSPESVERDYERKRELYQEYGISEYWIIDEMDQSVMLLRLKTGEYRQVRPKKGELHSKALAGFWLRPEWLWQEPRPDEFDTLMEILAKQPHR
ncbi:MAG TPA: Uma2 family endonuclease [Gemmataceae bacterium]|nr:Uma2 family endonuclease [Gemmataceae bacterium]